MMFKKRLKRSFLKVIIMSTITAGICSAYPNIEFANSSEHVYENSKNIHETKNIEHSSKESDNLKEQTLDQMSLDSTTEYEDNLSYEIYKKNEDDKVDVMISFAEPISSSIEDGWTLSEDECKLLKTFYKNEEEKIVIRSQDGSKLVYVDIKVYIVPKKDENRENELESTNESDVNGTFTEILKTEEENQYKIQTEKEDLPHNKHSATNEKKLSPCDVDYEINSDAKDIPKDEVYNDFLFIPEGKEDG